MRVGVLPVSDSPAAGVTGRPYEIAVVLVGCGEAKADVDEPVRAHELYTSGYFSLKFRVGQQLAHRSHILSAEHHLLSPYRDTIAPYDTTMEDVDGQEWARTVMDQLIASVSQARRTAYPVTDPTAIWIVLLAGADYRDPLRPYLRSVPWQVVSPFEDTDGLFEQQALLRDWLDAAEADPDADPLAELDPSADYQQDLAAGLW